MGRGGERRLPTREARNPSVAGLGEDTASQLATGVDHWPDLGLGLAPSSGTGVGARRRCATCCDRPVADRDLAGCAGAKISPFYFAGRRRRLASAIGGGGGGGGHVVGAQRNHG